MRAARLLRAQGIAAFPRISPEMPNTVLEPRKSPALSREGAVEKEAASPCAALALPGLPEAVRGTRGWRPPAADLSSRPTGLCQELALGERASERYIPLEHSSSIPTPKSMDTTAPSSAMKINWKVATALIFS